MLATMLTDSDYKKKRWLKRPKQSSKKRNLNQNANDSKSHIWNSFFWRYFGHATFLYSSTCSSQYQGFFISDFLAKSLKVNRKWQKKITHFTWQFCSKKLTHFMNLNSLDIKNNMLLQHNQKPFWLYRFSS